MKRTRCSPWISSELHWSSVGEVCYFQSTVSARRVSAQSLKRACHVANHAARKVKRHVFGKDVRRMRAHVTRALKRCMTNFEINGHLVVVSLCA